MRITFEMPADDLEELVHIVHNVMMDIEESNGNDLDPQLLILRAFVKQIEGRY